MAPRAEVPRASNSNALVCQTSITTSIGAKGLSAPLSNHSSLKILVELADRRGRSGASLPDVTVFVGSGRQPLLGAARVLMAMGSSPDPLAESKSRQLELTGSVEPDGRGRVGTIRILVESVDRRGRSSASLPEDGTILVGSSRQPFLDAARVLIASGYDPDSWLESWRPGATAFALRGRLKIAAALTVDETKTAFAKWKAFSSSAVLSSSDYSEVPAITLPLGIDELPQPSSDQSLVTSAGRLPSVEGEAK